MTLQTSLSHRYLSSDSAQVFVLLHGYGSNMDDLFSFSSELQPLGHVVSLNAPTVLPFGGHAWFDLDFSGNSIRVVNKNQIDEAIVHLQKDITSICEFLHLQQKDVILMGFSQGAMMSLELVLRSLPTSFKAAVLMSGRGAQSPMTQQIQTPILQTHGMVDPVIDITDARQLRQHLEPIAKDYTYKEYSNMAHGIAPECWDDILEFLKEKSA